MPDATSSSSGPDPITVGIRVPFEFTGGASELREFVGHAEAAGIDRLYAGDHVSFRGGQGFDGLVTASALAAASSHITVQTSVYLLALRHPVPVARQLSSLASLAGGRLLFGVGLGGDDRSEYRACGLDPATRGARLNEALAVLRALADGTEVTMAGRFFQLDGVSIRPAPQPRVPIVIGGRSDAALRRVARFGDGWLGLWVSPDRYDEAVSQVRDYAAEAGRQLGYWRHAMHVWCGLGADAGAARSGLSAAMEDLYQLPFGKFERYCPYGTPEDIAAGLRPYVTAGCRTFNLSLVGGGTAAETIDGAVAVRDILRKETP